MAKWYGPGPVFVFECIALARRRQLYLLRVLLVLALLAVLGLVWAPAGRTYTNPADLAQITAGFFAGIVNVQLAAVLLAAPAATAGALCVDKSRGTLFHVFATDLSGREIVLGKLAARLAPVFALMFSGLPVLALSGLLGGVDPDAVFGAYAVTAGVAILGCSLALMLSVWAKKTQQALLPAYGLIGAWIALTGVIAGMLVTPPGAYPRRFGFMANPFALLHAPGDFPDEFGLIDQLAFLGASVLVSTVFVIVATVRIRAVALEQVSRPKRTHRPGLAARVIALVPGPSLDDNPVLWREWHRRRPLRWTGRFWTAYAVATGLASLAVIVAYFLDPHGGVHVLAAHANAWELTVGLLLLSVSAASALSEERDRGSLDVIMATPLPSRAIVRGKWWGTFALVPRLMIFPVWVTCAFALITDRWTGVFWLLVLTLAYAAAVTSLGLAVATWVRNPGRAVAVTLLVYVIVAAGWPSAIWGGSRMLGLWRSTEEKLLLGSPFFAVQSTTEHAGLFDFNRSDWRFGRQYWPDWLSHDPTWPLGWAVLYGIAAAVILAVTSATFSHCLGRATVDEHADEDERRSEPGPQLQNLPRS